MAGALGNGAGGGEEFLLSLWGALYESHHAALMLRISQIALQIRNRTSLTGCYPIDAVALTTGCLWCHIT